MAGRAAQDAVLAKPAVDVEMTAAAATVYAALFRTLACSAAPGSRDLARVGLLMQRHGRWRERQLLPLAWVEFNLTPFARYRPSAEEEGEAVPGGQWWLNRAVKGAPAPWPDVAETAFAALGHWGQALYVLPEEKLVIVRYADDRDGRFRHTEFLRLAQAAFVGEARP